MADNNMSWSLTVPLTENYFRKAYWKQLNLAAMKLEFEEKANKKFGLSKRNNMELTFRSFAVINKCGCGWKHHKVS